MINQKVPQSPSISTDSRPKPTMMPIKTPKPRFEPLSSMQFSCSDPLESYSCTRCDASFSLKSTLLKHIKQGHQLLETKPEIEYKCNKCDFTTFSKIILAKHDLNCQVIYPQPCSESVLTSPLEPDEEIVCDQPIQDIICSLLVKPFCKREDSERDEIIMYGRPTPLLSISLIESNEESDEEHTSSESSNEDTLDNKEQHESEPVFNGSDPEHLFHCSDSESSHNSSHEEVEETCKNLGEIYYIDHSWLCGSYYIQRVFCWPCLLFGSVENEWTKFGVDEFHYLKYYIIEHETSSEHIENTNKLEQVRSKLGILGTSPIFSIANHNENVLKNRLLAEIFIRATILVLKSGQENTVSTFQHLLEFLLLLGGDSSIKNHYHNIRAVFPGDVESFYDDVVTCITSYMEEFIKKEVKKAPFFTVRIDDAFLVTGNSQCAVIIRFVNSEGQLVERFLGFHTVKEKVKSLYNIVDTVLGNLDYKKKLVGVTHDGGKPSLILDLFVGKVREEVRQAHFIYCIEHRFDLLLQQSLKNHSTLDFIWNCNQFYKISPNIMRIMPEWPSKPVNLYKTVRAKWDRLKEVLQEIDDDGSWFGDASYHARSLLRDMNSLYFAFFVCVFSDLFDKIGPLSAYLQQETTSVETLLKLVRTCYSDVETMRKEEVFQEFFEEAKSKSDFEKERRELYKRWYFETIDNVMLDLDMRFRDVVKLKFVALADSSKFEQYSKQFPLKLCKNLQRSYPEIFLDLDALICELEVFYQIKTYYERDLEDIVKLLNKNKFHNIVFGEVYKLFCLILSFPLTKIKRKPYFKFIKTCAEYSTQDHLDEYVNSNQVQWDLLEELSIKTKNFFSDIIDKFAAKNTRPVDLMFMK